MRTEDGEIIHQCLNGKPAAFGFLVDKYKACIFAFAYSELGNFHDAEDITQDVFIKAYQKLNTLKQYDRFLAWLYAITSNLCKNLIRSKRNRPDGEFIEDQAPETLMEPSIDSYREGIITESLNEAIDSLPKIYSQALTLHYLGGMNVIEIARFLGTSPNTIKHRLSRGRTQLKEEVVVMISESFSQQRLQASFTFRIIEAVKRIKIHPVSTMKGLPWGLSLATGIIITVMSLNPYVPWFSRIGAYARSVLPSETKVLRVGEIPVDVVKTSNVAILSNKMGKGKGGEPKQPNENAFFMAPQGQGDTWTKKTDMPTARCVLSTSAVNGKIYAIGGLDITFINQLSTVEEYDTGFTGENVSVEAKGKLPTKWGQMKRWR
jgi:RNA polymerase sigma factor (sigma-70 family)